MVIEWPPFPFAWYKSTTTVVNPTSQQAHVFAAAAVGDANVSFNIKVEEYTTNNKSKLMLTTATEISEDTKNIHLVAGDGAYYVGNVADKAHMHVQTQDENHLKAIALKITISAQTGVQYPAGTYHVQTAVGGIGRLGVSLSTCATDSAKYVGTNTAVIMDVTIAAGASDFADVVGYAYISLSGTKEAIEEDKSVGTSDWTFTVEGSGTANALAESALEIEYAG